VALGMIAALQLNLPKSGAKMHGRVLKCMKYHVKTKHGISEAFYKATNNSYRLFGMGQGSGASSAVWLTISVILWSVLTALATVLMKFMDPGMTYLMNGTWMHAYYVDDSAKGGSNAHQEEVMTLTEILGHLQHNAQI